MKVSIAKIRPNPFQIRGPLDEVSIVALANEIKALGFWSPLRVREIDGHYELCFGHRRLQALKYLKWKDVDVDVVKLSDDDMAIQGLVENLQREGLTDIEKARGIQQLIRRFMETRHLDAIASREAAGTLVGLKRNRINELLSTLELNKRTQTLIQKKAISGQIALRAQEFGGQPMIDTAIKHQLSKHLADNIYSEVNSIPEPAIRERVRQAVIAGAVRDPVAVREQTRMVRRKAAARAGKRPPPDLLVVIRSWTQTMIAWNKKLDDVLPYLDYIESEPETAGAFKTANRDLIEKLKRFL